MSSSNAAASDCGRAAVQSSEGSAGEVSPQYAFAFGDARDLDVLLARVRKVGIARTEVDRRDTKRREPRDVGPAQLRHRFTTHGRSELRGSRFAESRQRTGRRVGRHDFVRRKDFLYMGERLRLVTIRRE